MPCSNARATSHVQNALAHDRPYLFSQRRHSCHELWIPIGADIEGLQLMAARGHGAPLLHLHRGQFLQSLLGTDQLLHPVLRVSQQPRLLGEAGPSEGERIDEKVVLRALLPLLGRRYK